MSSFWGLFLSAAGPHLLVGPSGLEPPTSCLSGTRSNHLSYEPSFKHILKDRGGDDGIRTHDPLLAGQVLSQLSYTPKFTFRFCFSPREPQNSFLRFEDPLV